MPAFTIATTTTDLGSQRTAIYCSGPVSSGIASPDRNRYRLLQCARHFVGDIDILATYTAKFGALVAGQTIFLRIVRLNSQGSRSTTTTASVVVT